MLKKHPRALAFIFFTEMWERVGFYTLMAILVLYMDKVLGWSDARKGDYYGLFLALCYFVPLLGGWLGDKVIGQIRTVRAGAFLMALGYVGLAVSGPDRVAPFYIGLLLIGLGTGIFKVNMAVLVGNLYAGKPQLKDAGYNIFYMGVNLGAMIAPLVATLNNAVFHSYNISFWVAAVGMVFALIIFRAGEPAAPAHGLQARRRRRQPGAPLPAGEAASLAAACPAVDKREERAAHRHPGHPLPHRHLLLGRLLPELLRPDPLRRAVDRRPEMAPARDLPVLRALLHPGPDPAPPRPLQPPEPEGPGALDAGQDPPRHAHHEPGHVHHGLGLARRRRTGTRTSCRRPGSSGPTSSSPWPRSSSRPWASRSSPRSPRRGSPG